MGKIYKVMWSITMCSKKGHRWIYLTLSLGFWSLVGMCIFTGLSGTGVFATGLLAGKELEAGIIIVGYTALIPGFLGAAVYAYRNIPACYFKDPRLEEGLDSRPAHEQKTPAKPVEDHVDRFLRYPVQKREKECRKTA